MSERTAQKNEKKQLISLGMLENFKLLLIWYTLSEFFSKKRQKLQKTPFFGIFSEFCSKIPQKT